MTETGLKETLVSPAGYGSDEPIAAIATPLAPAALGIIRTSGKGAVALLAKLFSRPRSLEAAKSRSLVHGWVLSPGGEAIDEVLVGVFRAPHGFTGEDAAEIYCHGGIAVPTALFRLLTAHGFREALRGEFTLRAYLNGKVDLTRAEAVREIIDAKTAEAGAHAAERLAGRLFAEIDAVKRQLVRMLAAIEAEIEYPEDENALADSFDSGALKDAEMRLATLCGTWAVEKVYQEGLRVVLAGKTNAGKSSIFNMLVKEERSIVSAEPGTTRDWVEAQVSFGGIPARLFDTAGIREAASEIEREGIRRTESLVKSADVTLYVVDAEAGMSAEDAAFLRGTAGSVIALVNKADRCGAGRAESVCAALSVPSVPFSAKTGERVGALADAVRAMVCGGGANPASRGGLGTERQKKAAESALGAARHALAALEEGFAPDAVAADIEEALDFLGEITGAVTPENILETVFSQFCLGK
jgi:tRNA modification GTPase